MTIFNRSGAWVYIYVHICRIIWRFVIMLNVKNLINLKDQIRIVVVDESYSRKKEKKFISIFAEGHNVSLCKSMAPSSGFNSSKPYYRRV